ncbi:polysaccharide pyruvyl transferase family protein [Weissella koreensis]|uniref:polysaccharide pyruvyl transferase family protein n=2 Tax=Weissella koreensis TaxID=165096 RepID=UPI000CF30428|nr:polysaccharide pyruvyl transferase family protein [Weissella koreensis]AVH75298.1 polysaccharide pyruvyl transferase family protein [Weissella koreensis]
MKHYYLISTAGYPNFGDEQIVRNWLAFFKKNHAHDQITLDVPFPARSSLLFKDEFPNINFVDTIWNLIYAGDDAGATLEDPVTLIHLLEGDAPRDFMGIENMKSADEIHLLGGGYFTTDRPEFNRTYLFFPILTYLKSLNPSLKLITHGLGLTPISNNYKIELETNYLSEFNYVGVRDKESAKIKGTTLELDDVFMSHKLNALRIDDQKDNPDILLVLKPINDQEKLKVFLNQLIQYLETEKNKNKTIGILEFMVPIDNWLFFEPYLNAIPTIKQRLTFFGFWDIWTKGIPYKKDQEWIVSRFHAHLIGSILKVKGSIFIESDQYYQTKQQSLLELGTGWQLIENDPTFNIKPSRNKLFTTQIALKIATKLSRMNK